MLFDLFFFFNFFVRQHLFSLCLRVRGCGNPTARPQRVKCDFTIEFYRVGLPWKGFRGWTKRDLPRFGGGTVSWGCLGEAPTGAFLGGASGATAAHKQGKPRGQQGRGGPWAAQAMNISPRRCHSLPGAPALLSCPEKSRRWTPTLWGGSAFLQLPL